MKELKINTRRSKDEEEEEGEAVSPTGQYFNSSVFSIAILAVLEFEVPLDDLQILPLIRDIFLPINPRFSSIMVRGRNGEKRWKKVEVNLEEHLIIPNFPSNLPLQDYDNLFNDYLTKLGVDPLPQNKPLWEIHLIKYPTSKAAGNVILKLHHALGDGYSLMGALLSCLKRADDPSLPLTFPASHGKQNPAGWFTTITSAICVAWYTLLDYASTILRSSVIEDDKTPIRSANPGLNHRPNEISTLEFSLDKVKHITTQLGMTVNDVVTGIIYHGVRLYMRGRSEKWGSSNSTALVLMNTRAIGDFKSVSEMLKPSQGNGKTLWGNQFAFLHASITKVSQNDEFLDPLKFVFKARRIIQRKRSSLAFKLVAQTLEIIRKRAGPEEAAKLIYKTIRNASICMTNMVGPVEKMALANHPVKGLYFIVVGAPRSLEITVLSYAETLRIGIGIEKNFIDMKEFKLCVEKAFQLTFNAATMR